MATRIAVLSCGFLLMLWQANRAVAQDCTWWRLRTHEGPGPRTRFAMAFDSHRGVVVVHGGMFVGSDIGGTWEWNAKDWTFRTDAGPSDRGDHAMAFDSLRNVVVMFGRDNSAEDNAETWEWDGQSWHIAATSGPPSRRGTAMAFDSARGVTVMFGGAQPPDFGGALMLGDTWEWDGMSWIERPVSGPSPRRDHAMVYDSHRKVVVLVGGSAGGTWEWDGVAWENHDPPGGPSNRMFHAMAYDSDRGLTVLFGGAGGLGDTWEWDGSAWTRRQVAGASPRFGHGMAYDSATRQVVLFGGSTGGGTSPEDYSGETWTTWDPSLIMDCNGNAVPDGCDVDLLQSPDCNHNGVPDECDIADGGSKDFDDDGIPDECEPDCNENTIPDDWDISSGTSDDCNRNNVPDECDSDCNENGIADACEIAVGHDCCVPLHGPGCNNAEIASCVCAVDVYCCQHDWDRVCAELVVDEACGSCDVVTDCDENGVPDECEPDCNQNYMTDACDLRDSRSLDCQGNGVPDECEPDFDLDGTIDDCDPDVDGDGVVNEEDVCEFTPLGSVVDAEGRPRGDANDDCDVDLSDYEAFAICLPISGPDNPPLFNDCLVFFDLDGDGDVDIVDFAVWQNSFTGTS